jgi:hypothetical protein
MNFIKSMVLIGTLFSITPDMKAWDEVTHAYMSGMIPEMINDPTLKELLAKNNNSFLAGSWFTDTYQYTGKYPRIEKLNPHNIKDLDSAFVRYLQKDEVKNQENYSRLIALYLGALAHLAEDLWFDNNLYPYQDKKQDRYKGDSKHGAFIAKQFGYIGIHVEQYLPYADLFRIYSEANLLPDSINTVEKLEQTMQPWAKTQYKKLTALKLLNFVAGNQLYSVSPWTAANLFDAPGGMKNSAQVAAKLVESTWARINKQSVEDILHTQYMWTTGNIAVFFSSPEAASRYSRYKGIAISGKGDTISGMFNYYNDIEMVQCFVPDQPLVNTEEYNFEIVSTEKNTELLSKSLYSYRFTASFDHIMDTNLANKKPWYQTLGLGFFGFIPAISLAGILFGLSGIIRMRRSLKEMKFKTLRGLMVMERFFQLAGLCAFGLAVYLFVSKGWIIVEIAL